MKKGLTDILVIVDASGSMAGTENDVTGTFNAFVEEQKFRRHGSLLPSRAKRSRFFVSRSPQGKGELMTEMRKYEGPGTLERAIEIAARAHDGAVDKGGWSPAEIKSSEVYTVEL